MPITFDTLDELKSFYRNFKLEEKGGNGNGAPRAATVKTNGVKSPAKGKPGRKPTVKKVEKVTVKPKRMVTKAAAPKKPAVPKGDTLTSKIKDTIQRFLDSHRSFTANDIYDDLSKRDNTVNKQSVITSVLKQMNSSFKTIAVTERPGNGPRAVKLYNAK